jgi:hypothetical protein
MIIRNIKSLMHVMYYMKYSSLTEGMKPVIIQRGGLLVTFLQCMDQ